MQFLHNEDKTILGVNENEVNGPFESSCHYILASIMSHGEKVSVCQIWFSSR